MENSDAEESLNYICPDIIEEVIQKKDKTITKQYKKGKFLGKGGFAKCYEMTCIENDKLYAAKIVSKANLNKSQSQQKLKSEIKIHKSLFHKHIVKFEHVFEDNDNVYILLELCKNKTLNEIMKKRKIITELEVKYFLEQILKAVNFMHKSKVVHRDLKLGNLFLNEDMEIKIGDFGLATTIEFSGQLRHTVCGTPNYIAPEILEGKNGGHSYEVDFWAIGVIVYTLLIGRPPFETDDVKETYKKIKAKDFTYPTNIFISNEAKDFINRLLILNPSERMKIDEMKSHPFMKLNPAPKKISETIASVPPDSIFLKNHMIDQMHIKSPLEESQIYTNDYILYLENLKQFSVNNVVKVKNSVLDHCFRIENEEEISKVINKTNEAYSIYKKTHVINYKKKTDPVENMKYLNDHHNLSFNKHFNVSLAKKVNKDINNIIFLTDIIDNSDTIGVAYITNQNVVGYLFNDKSVLYKTSSKIGFKSNSLALSEYSSSKDLAKNLPELNKKIKYLDEASKKLTCEHKYKGEERSSTIYVMKVFLSDLAYFLKLSNGFIQLIFYDSSMLIVGNSVTSDVYFIDKKGVVSSYNIHQINKSKNKNMLKRYDHYKKVFYEKLESRVNNRQKEPQSPNVEENEEEITDNKEKVDLNKTL